MNAFPAGVTSRARAQIGDAADGAAVDAIELAVGAGRLGRVRGCSAGFRGLTVIACIALATSRARARSVTPPMVPPLMHQNVPSASGPLFRVCGAVQVFRGLTVISSKAQARTCTCNLRHCRQSHRHLCTRTRRRYPSSWSSPSRQSKRWRPRNLRLRIPGYNFDICILLGQGRSLCRH